MIRHRPLLISGTRHTVWEKVWGKMGRLTATRINSALKKPGKHGDGDGLFLQVGKGEIASWILRVQKDGRRRDIGLGSLKKVSLSQARDRASFFRSLVEAGLDPVMERKKAAGIPTFRKAAETVHSEHKATWRNAKHRDQWIKTLESYAFPKIGDRPVNTIQPSMIRDLLVEIWCEKPETAQRVLQRVCAVLDWALSKGYRETELSRSTIARGLPRRPRTTHHFAAMPYTALPRFVARLREKETISRLALEALILTAGRSGEIRLATWDEVDLEAGLWSIPGSRMKAKRDHIVPLSKQAIRVFRRAADWRTGGSQYVFPGLKSKKPLSDMSLTKVLRDMGELVTVHGFRSSFRDWIGEETAITSEVAEAALAHAKGKVEAAYHRGSQLGKRRWAMEQWGSYVDGESSKPPTAQAPPLRIVA